MSHRAARLIVASGLALWGSAVQAQTLVTELRAERSGDSKSGRVYHLTATARDLAGNEMTGTATCTVPHDQGKEK